MKQYYYQCPREGIFPQVLLESNNECFIYDIDSPMWKSVIEVPCRHLSIRQECERIPAFCINSGLEIELILSLTDIIDMRPAGAIGIWAREFYALPHDKGIIYDLTLGLIWHPNPDSLNKCKAYEIDPTLKWMQLDGINDLWHRIPKIGNFPKLFSEK